MYSRILFEGSIAPNSILVVDKVLLSRKQKKLSSISRDDPKRVSLAGSE